MKPLHRGIAVAVVHCLIVLSLAGKYAVDRERLPRVWVQTAPIDPNLPIRGRYVRLRVQVDFTPVTSGDWIPARLSVGNDRLVGEEGRPGDGIYLRRIGELWTIVEPLAFFIPEHVPDPSQRAAGEELWVEVSVPKKGNVRPIRLGVKKDGVLTPLPLR